MKFDIRVFFENSVKKIQPSLNLTRITCSLHEAVYTFMAVSRSYLFRMRNISDNNVEKIHTHFIFNVFSSKIVPVVR